MPQTERATSVTRLLNSRAVILSACLVLFAHISTAQAQTKQDEESLRRLPGAFSDAFNKHDGHQLAAIMAENVDFVTVGLTWLTRPPRFGLMTMVAEKRANDWVVTSVQNVNGPVGVAPSPEANGIRTPPIVVPRPK